MIAATPGNAGNSWDAGRSGAPLWRHTLAFNRGIDQGELAPEYHAPMDTLS